MKSNNDETFASYKSFNNFWVIKNSCIAIEKVN